MNPLARYLHQVRRWWWFVVICTILGGGVSFGIASITPSDYQATAKLLVSVSNTPDQVILDDVLVSERLTKTYSELIDTRPVMEEAANRLEGPESASDLSDKVSASGNPDTQIIEVSASSDEADRAAEVANVVAAVFVERIEASTSPVGTVAIVEAANAPSSQVGPSVPLRTVAGVLAGLSLALILLAAVTFFDSSIWSADDTRAFGLDLPCLGVIRNGSMGYSVRLPNGRDAPALTTATRDATATTLSVLWSLKPRNGNCPVVAVVSANGGEGRTSLVACLGFSAAESGRRVTLIDFDLENPHLHERFNIDNDYGITDYMFSLRTATPMADYKGVSVIEGLRLIPRGKNTRTANRLDSNTVLDAIERLASDGSEMIILDTPPLGESPEALILSQSLDAVIIIADARQTTAESLSAMMRQLGMWGVPLPGYVLNRR